MAGSGLDLKGKDYYMKKIDMCNQIFDYKDEHKDVKGKTDRLNAIQELQQMLQD